MLTLSCAEKGTEQLTTWLLLTHQKEERTDFISYLESPVIVQMVGYGPSVGCAIQETSCSALMGM